MKGRCGRREWRERGSIERESKEREEGRNEWMVNWMDRAMEGEGMGKEKDRGMDN